MRIHKEGLKIIAYTTVVTGTISVCGWVFIPVPVIAFTLTAAMFLLLAFTVRFFRVPRRIPGPADELAIYAPADGEVVAIEQTYEAEYFKDERIQVSIFMSIWNVHMNWFPVGGMIEYKKHHHGKFLVAWHPKSSTENERTTTVVSTPNGQQVMFRQIAGFVARRIVNYAKEGDAAHQNRNVGFIKFGSRVDIFLPLGTHIDVELGEQTVGTKTVIATLPKKYFSNSSRDTNEPPQCN